MRKNWGRCLSSRPGTTDQEEAVVHWPIVTEDFRCGKGKVISDGSEIISCVTCLHWWQPNQAPIDPIGRAGMGREWWTGSGYCTAASPHPEFERVYRPRRHGVTHALAGCGDGEPVQAAQTTQQSDS